MLTLVDRGEGGVKNGQKSADVLYGRSQGLILTLYVIKLENAMELLVEKSWVHCVLDVKALNSFASRHNTIDKFCPIKSNFCNVSFNISSFLKINLGS